MGINSSSSRARSTAYIDLFRLSVLPRRKALLSGALSCWPTIMTALEHLERERRRRTQVHKLLRMSSSKKG